MTGYKAHLDLLEEAKPKYYTDCTYTENPSIPLSKNKEDRTGWSAKLLDICSDQFKNNPLIKILKKKITKNK